MFKYAISLLIPFVSFSASVITKPYDQLDKNDAVVTNVNFSGLTTPSDVTNIAQYVASSGSSTTDLVARASADSAYLLATNTYNITTQKLDRVNGTSTNQTLMLATVGDHLSFALTTQPVLNAGEIAWDPDWLTFKAGLSNGVEGQFFQEHHIVVKNAWTNTIQNGWVVMHSGTVGNSGKYEVVPAISTPTLDPTRVLGMTTESIPVGGIGRITARGNVNEIGSDGSLYGASGWQNNTPVYLCTTHVGWVTTNMIQAPYPRVYVGNIVRAHPNGAIYIRVQPGLRLSDLDDVDGTPLTSTGQIPVYDSVRGVFDFNRNVNEFAGTNAVAVHTNRTDNPHSVTLAQAAAAGGFEGTEDIGPLRVSASRYGEGSGDGASGTGWTALGFGAGSLSAGDYWSAVGNSSGYNVSGNSWAAFGYSAGLFAKGDEWSAFGLLAGASSIWTNSTAIGNYTGKRARGSHRLYIDNYDEDPSYSVGGATNDMIFGDNGYLTLGRGAGAPGGSKGGTLRGVWGVGSITNATLTGNANVSGDTLIGAQAITNAIQSDLAKYTTFAQVTNTVVGMGVVTNGQPGPVTLSGVSLSGPGFIYTDGTVRGLGVGGQYSWVGSRIGIEDDDAYGESGGALAILDYDTYMVPQQVRVGSILVASTRTGAPSAGISSSGHFLVGPTIDGKQAHLFSNGTNFYTVSVNGDTNSFSPPTIVQPIRQSATNIVIAATNAVYAISITNAANIGFDFSGLALGGTNRAEATVFIDCLNTQALYSAINTNAVSMDCAWEPTVTGRYELAVSSDGVKTTARQVWPQSDTWYQMTSARHSDVVGIWLSENSNDSVFYLRNPIVGSDLMVQTQWDNVGSYVRSGWITVGASIRWDNLSGSSVFESNEFSAASSGYRKTPIVYAPFSGYENSDTELGHPASITYFRFEYSQTAAEIRLSLGASKARRANALERAAYNAGAYPAAFRLDY